MRSENRRGISPLKIIFWGTVGGVVAGVSLLYLATKKREPKRIEELSAAGMDGDEGTKAFCLTPQFSPHEPMPEFQGREKLEKGRAVSEMTLSSAVVAAEAPMIESAPRLVETPLFEQKESDRKISFKESLILSRQARENSLQQDQPVTLKFLTSENRDQDDTPGLFETNEWNDGDANSAVCFDTSTSQASLETAEPSISGGETAGLEIASASASWLDDAPTEKLTSLSSNVAPFFANTGLQDKDVWEALKDGRNLCNSQKFIEAERVYRKCQEEYPEEVRIHNALGTLYAEQGKYGEAEKAWLRALSIEPSTETYNFLGSVWESQGRYDDAVEAYQKALAMNPQDVMARSNLGWIFTSQRKYARARKEFQKATPEHYADTPREERSGKKRG